MMRKNAAITGCLVAQMCVGILYLWSAFKTDIAMAYGPELGWTSGGANLVSSFMLFAYVLGCLIGGFLNDRKGPRFTCFASMTLFVGGVALSAFAHHIVAFTFTYAVMAGLGSGFSNTACISCVQRWLPHRRGLASGLACGAFGLSTVIFAPVSVRLMDYFRDNAGIVNFMPVFLTLAAVFATLGFTGCFLISTPDEEAFRGLNLPGAASRTPSQAVRTSAFWGLFFTIFFFNGTWNLCVPVIRDLGVRRGLSETLAVACLSFTGITNAAGRLVMSPLSDRWGRNRVLYILCGLTFVSALLLTFADGVGYFAVIALLAFAYGGAAPLSAALCADLFGLRHLGTILGAALLALGLSSVFFNLISSSVLHSTAENMTATFLMGAATAVIPAFLMKRFLKPQGGPVL